jgi:hypothetical protein
MKSNFIQRLFKRLKSIFVKPKKVITKNINVTAQSFLENRTVTVEANPVYIPRKHTVESYRSQQRKAKQKRKSKKQ